MALEDKERHASWGRGHKAEMHAIYCKAANSPARLEQKGLEQVVGNKIGNSESGCRAPHARLSSFTFALYFRFLQYFEHQAM